MQNFISYIDKLVAQELPLFLFQEAGNKTIKVLQQKDNQVHNYKHNQ